VDIINVTQLSPKSSNKFRLLKVQCSDFRQQQQLLMHARKLRKIEEFKNVYVSPDLTQKERISQKELRQELAQRKAYGEKDICVYL